MRWGLGRSLAMIALIVQAPRLILSILDADQIAIQPSVRQTLLIIAAIGTASILTGGQLYLIHVIGTVRKWRPGLVIIWLGVLTFSGAMIIPAVFGGLSSTLLPSVLSLEQKLWWSLIAAMSHELTAAGCVLASIAHDRDRAEGGSSGLSEDDLLLKVTTERNELEEEVNRLRDMWDEEEIERKKARVTEQAEMTQRMHAADTSLAKLAHDQQKQELNSAREKFGAPLVRPIVDRLINAGGAPQSELIRGYVAPLTQPSPYPFPCIHCGQPIHSPADAFNHSNCGANQ